MPRSQEEQNVIKRKIVEVSTAVVTAFFTALMFRVGSTMLVSILVGLAAAYSIRLFLLRWVVELIGNWFFRREAAAEEAAQRRDGD